MGVIVTILNFLYLTATLILALSTNYPVPPIHLAECTAISNLRCSPSYDSPLYKDQLTALITKMVVILIAIIIELLVAIKAPIKITLLPASWCHSSKCLRPVQVILLWNTFVFVQIWLGLISLPACILLLITPLQTLPVLCGIVLAVILFIVCLLQFRNQYRVRTSHFGRACGYFSWYLLLFALIVAVYALYFFLAPTGTSLSTGGVIFSLLPSIALSVVSWLAKRKFLSKNPSKKNKVKVEKQSSISSVSTVEEDQQGADTEQDVALDDLMRSGEH